MFRDENWQRNRQDFIDIPNMTDSFCKVITEKADTVMDMLVVFIAHVLKQMLYELVWQPGKQFRSFILSSCKVHFMIHV